MSAALPLGFAISDKAPMTHLPLALPCMAAASSVPVPSGLVSTNACPDRRPPLDITPASATSPVTLKPRASSGPSQVWPPTNAHPDSLRTSMAPLMSCVSSSVTRRSAMRGTTARAKALTGFAPMAHTSPRAWLAAILPKMYGSSQKARKKSTLCTSSLPGGGGLMSAASSGLSNPITTSGLEIGRGCTWARAAASTLAPTLAPQPPHRILDSASKASASGPAAPKTGGGPGGRWALAPVPDIIFIMSGKSSPYLRMNALSI
mmetsp:Transcript_23725/g.61646  ORF Transcript_23725/g.61646 Transcript_23725/m.61646 type:complete len:262 (-) Transcript_23725:950-1735(-)